MFELPLFPLNTVLFPGMPLQLHIFEERYRMMMQRVLTTNQTFGVNLIRNGTEANGPLAEPYPIGCTARVVSVEPLDDGRMNMTVVGDERYRIVRLGSAQPYLTAFVESLPLHQHHTMEVVRGAHLLRPRVLRYLGMLAKAVQEDEPPAEDESAELSGADPLDVGQMPGEPEAADEEEQELDLSQIQLPEDPLMLINMAAALLQVPSVEKQPVLEANTAGEMMREVQRLYRRELAVLPSVIEVSAEQARLSAWVN